MAVNTTDLLPTLTPEQRITYLERLVRISQTLNSTLDLESLLDLIIESATELAGCEACSIMLLDRRSGELRFARSAGETAERVKGLVVPLGSSIAGWVVRSGQPLLVADVKEEPRWNPNIDRTIGYDTRSIVAVPLKARDCTIGVMELINKAGPRGFNHDDLQIAGALAAHAAIALENARLMSELQVAYDKLAELDHLKGEFVNIASHELRTPLSVILVYASFLQEQVSGQASEQLAMVLQSALRLRAIIDDLVNLRHVDIGQAITECSSFSMKELIAEVAGEFSELCRAKSLSVTLSPADTALDLVADRQKVHLVLTNLLSNAIKFTPAYGRILISALRKDEEIRVSVADTGIGIPQREQERVFDRFYQVGSSLDRHYQGAGLGLSIAKSMVDLHKGRIWVESVPDQGSCFTFALPLSPAIVNPIPVPGH
jgi:signal transduction histidine kinase